MPSKLHFGKYVVSKYGGLWHVADNYGLTYGSFGMKKLAVQQARKLLWQHKARIRQSAELGRQHATA